MTDDRGIPAGWEEGNKFIESYNRTDRSTPVNDNDPVFQYVHVTIGEDGRDVSGDYDTHVHVKLADGREVQIAADGMCVVNKAGAPADDPGTSFEIPFPM
jgi:hypothetical protein